MLPGESARRPDQKAQIRGSTQPRRCINPGDGSPGPGNRPTGFSRMRSRSSICSTNKCATGKKPQHAQFHRSKGRDLRQGLPRRGQAKFWQIRHGRLNWPGCSRRRKAVLESAFAGLDDFDEAKPTNMRTNRIFTVNMCEAKVRLTRLVRATERGEPFVIARVAKPLVKVAEFAVRMSDPLGELAFLPARSGHRMISTILAR